MAESSLRRVLLLVSPGTSTGGFEAALHKAGHAVSRVHQAEAALRFVEEDDPDVVFLANSFDWAQDEEFCSALKHAGTSSSRPLVLIRIGDGDGPSCASADEVIGMRADEGELLAITRSMVRLREHRAERDRNEEGLRESAKQVARLLDEVRFRNAQIEVKNMLIELDLEMAHEIEKALLDAALPVVPGVELGAYCRPSRRVGGDLCCGHAFDTGSVGLCVADVAGHGLAAALVAAMARTCFNCFAPGSEEPVPLLERMDAHLAPVLTMGLYVTVFYGVYHPGEERLVFASAGHPPPILVSSAGGPDSLLETAGHVIGAVEEEVFEQGETKLSTGDALVVYTDGIDEAVSPDGERYGSNRLHADAREHHHLPAAELASVLGQTVTDWTAGEPMRDDITILVVKRSP